MPRERHDSSSSGSSSDDDSSGSSSGSEASNKGHLRKTPKKEPGASKSRSAEVSLSRTSKHGSGDEGSKEIRIKKEVRSDSPGSSSEGDDMHRSGPRSTVVQKVGTPSKDKDKGKGRDDADKTSVDDNKKDKSRGKRDDNDASRSKKRSRSQSPRSRDSKRFRDESGRDRDRRPRDDRDSERDRNRRYEGDRRRGDDRRRDDDRRGGDRSRNDGGRDRYDGRGDRDRDRRDDRKSDRDGGGGGDRRRDRNDRDKDRGDSRREDNKENKKEEENDPQKRRAEDVNGEKPPAPEAEPPPKKAKDEDNIMTRTGGAYIPPAKLRMMQAQITDKSSVAYQRMAWEALKKSINGLINKVNVSNIVEIVRELFQENIVRGRGLLSRSMTQAQAASQTFTHVYAALVAIINTKFPQIGELILQRLILQFKRGFKRNDKNQCLASSRFIAHLVNQQVAHEVVALEILTLLLENATEDSVEVAISFLKECGQKLTEVSPRGINAVFERLRSILHESQLDKRVQYMVEVMFAIRKDGFKAHPAIISDLDLVEEEDQFTHILQLDDVTTGLEQLNIFRADDDYLENEEKYKDLKKEILDEGSSDEEGSGDESGSDDSSDDDDEENEEPKQEINDQTETNMVHLRRTIYLTIQSSLDFEECAHKLLKMELKPGQEVELCYMILDCCAQLRTYEKFFGLLAQRFCQLDKKYVEPFQTIFREQFETIHRLDTNKLRNVAKLFAHLLHTDSISWGVMQCMKLTEEDTTSASRIFIKILFLELSEYMGLPKLNKRLRDPTLQEFFEGILPRANPKDTRFAINFFTTIGLGGLTEDLREHLKGISKQLMQQKQQQEQQLLQQQQQQQQAAESSESDSSESDSSESDSSDSSSGSSDSSDSESDSSSNSESRKKKKKKRGQQQKSGSKKGKNKGGKEKGAKWPRSGSRPQEEKDQHKQGRRDDRRQPYPQEEQPQRGPNREMNGRHSNSDEGSRSRITDKLLKLSLPEGMSLVDPSRMPRELPFRKGMKGKEGGKGGGGRGGGGVGKRGRKGNKRGDRGRMGQLNHNSDRELHGSSSFEQGSDRDQAYFMEDMGLRRGMSPPGRLGRPADGYDMMDRQGGRLDMSPPPRVRGHAMPDDYRMADRRDLDLSPPMRREMDRGMGSPLMRGRYESPPRHLDMDDPRRAYVDDLPPLDRRMVDSPPPRYQMERDLDSPRGPPPRMTPPPLPRGGRRDMESPPPRRMDSPPRRGGSRADLDREMQRVRDDMDRGREMDRRRAPDMDRGVRSEVVERGGRADNRDRSLDRMRGDDRSLDRGGAMDRGRDPEPRRRDFERDLDRGRGDLGPSPRGGRDLDRGRSGGRGDSPRAERRDIPRSPPPPLPSRRESSHSSLVREGERRKGGGDAFEGEGGRGGRRSLSPVARKSRSRNDDAGPPPRRRSLSRERDDRRKSSGRTEREVSRDRARDKRRR